MPPRDTMFSIPDEEERSVQILTISLEDDDTDEGIALCSVSSSEADSIAETDDIDNDNHHDNPTKIKSEVFAKTHHRGSYASSPPLLVDEHRDDKDNNSAQAIVRQESNGDLSDDEVLVVETFSEVVSPPRNQKPIIDMSVQGSLVVGTPPENGMVKKQAETGSSPPNIGNITPTNTQHNNKQDSVVKCVRQQFENEEENFNTDKVSDDLERFNLSQRAQCEAYEQKKRETLILHHGALDIRASASCESNQSPGPSPMGFAFEGGLSAYVFVIHDRHGLLMKKVSPNPEMQHQYQIPGGVVHDCDFATAGRLCGSSICDLLLSASRLGAARELFAETAIDVRANLDRLIPANLRHDSFHKLIATASLQNQFRNHLYFFLFLKDEDFLSESIASAFCNIDKTIGDSDSGSWSTLRILESDFVFESDPVVASDMLANQNEFAAADALILSISEGHPMYNVTVAGLQYQSMAKLVSASEEVVAYEDRKIKRQRRSTREEKTTGPYPDAMAILTYITDIWHSKPEDHPEDISTLLRFLVAQETPNFNGEEVIRVQKELDAVRAWRRMYDGFQVHSQLPKLHCPDDDLLRQLFTMKAVLREHKDLCESMKKVEQSHTEMEKKPAKHDRSDDNKCDDEVAPLESVLSNLESHIESLTEKRMTAEIKELTRAKVTKAKKKEKKRAKRPHSEKVDDNSDQSSNTGTIDSLEGRRSIAGGHAYIYPFLYWDQLQRNPSCRLKNKIVLSDVDEVEVVAVVFVSKQPKLFDSCLCVLNNEKPSALKNRQPDQTKNLRVKFLLRKESLVGNSTTTSQKNGKYKGRTTFCCWCR